MKRLLVSLAALALLGSAQAAGLNLGNYTVTASYGLDINPGSLGVSGLEASAVAYAKDRQSLFFVGDEGTGVVEISLTGQTLGTMAFDWTGTGSTKHDTEGLTYVGNGQLVVGEERLYDAYKFSYVNGGTASLANAGVSISNANVGNDGMEGIAYDARNGGSFVTVKQDVPEDILAGTLSFGAGLSGTASMSQLFDPSKLGVTTLSDVAVLSGVDSLAGTAAGDNLLFLSLGSRLLIEADRSGNIVSRFDLSNVLAHNGIEGVTVDEHGTIYLVAEQIQDGSASGALKSQLIVLSASAVPEPASAALMLLGGAGVAGIAARRRRAAARHPHVTEAPHTAS